MITLLHSLKDVALKDESSNRMTHTYLLQALISADFCCRSYRAAADRGDNYKKAFIVPVVIDGLSLLCGHATLLVLPSLLPPCPPAPSPTSGRMPARARPPARVPSNWCRLLDKDTANDEKARTRCNAEHRKFNVAILSEYPRIGRLRVKRRSVECRRSDNAAKYRFETF